jgi:peptidoglycan hydrolase FlgJ
MAIKPPSDIVLEVSQAADPERLKVAAAKLEKLGESAGTAFAQVMDKVETTPPAQSSAKTPLPDLRGPPRPSLPFDVAQARLDLRNDVSRLQNAAQAASTPNDRAKALQDFEAVVLQSFIASMLPEGAEGVYGEGTAGSVWKSMLAEQIGKQMAKSGGIGIADRIMASGASPLGGKPGLDLAALGVGQRPGMTGMPSAGLSAILSASSRI